MTLASPEVWISWLRKEENVHSACNLMGYKKCENNSSDGCVVRLGIIFST